MLFVKKVGERVVLFDERLDFVKDYPSSKIVVGEERITIENDKGVVLELPKQQVGIMYQ